MEEMEYRLSGSDTEGSPSSGATAFGDADVHQILETLVLNRYEAVFSVDIATRRYAFTRGRENARLNVPAEGYFEETNERFCTTQILADDREEFLKETRFDRILSELGKNGKHAVRYRILNRDRQLQYRNLSFIYSDDRLGLIGAITDETEDILDRIEKSRDLWLKNECIRFVVRHMCENFIITNPETDESTTFVHDHRKMLPKASWKEQIRWFADNIVVPEEREDYLAFFEAGSIVERIRKSNGVLKQPCTVNYSDGRRDLVITCTLITDPEPDGQDEQKTYLFTSAQDVTSLKRARETGDRLLAKSRQDLLTGLYNRDTTEKMVRESLYSGNPDEWNTLILIDIDHFKCFNDTYGHMLGDAVLRFMGDAMREIFRASDVLCRWGGDEFVIFIPRFKDQASLEKRLGALQARMKEFKNSKGPMPITLSIGGVIAKNGTTLNALFAKADEALYTVKSRGRDGIVLDRIEPVQETAEVP